jgi:nucleotide-binding universal stress UspA family protein
MGGSADGRHTFAMEKLTRILAVAHGPDDVHSVLDKAGVLARSFGARVEFFAESSPRLQLQRTIDSGADLVIKAPQGAHPLRRWSLEDNDWEFANECPVPVLLARRQKWGDELKFAVAVDAGDEHAAVLARSLLHTAGFLALGSHAGLDILYSEPEQQDQRLRMERTVRLAQLVREYHVGCEHIRRLEGEPERTLPAHVSRHHYDVLVVGAQSRRQGIASFLPGTTSRLVDNTAGDVLLVKALPAQAQAEAAPLLREKGPYQSQQLA